MENYTERDSVFEEEIRAAMGVPAAPQGFLLSLRKSVLDQTPCRAVRNKKWLFTPVPLWSAVLLLIIAVVLTIGPTKVFAALEQYMGYVSGAGFVSTKNAVAMKAPLTENSNGRVLHVDQLISSDTESVLVLRWNSFGRAVERGQQPYIALIDRSGKALLPTSQFVRSISGSSDPDIPAEYMGTYHFAPLARGTRRVDLYFQEAQKFAPHLAVSHALSVKLYPIDDPEIARLLPSSYAPQGASVEVHGIRVGIEMVSSNPSDTGVRTLVTYPSEFACMGPSRVELIDANGRSYYPDIGMSTYDPGTMPVQMPAAASAYETFGFPYFPHDSPTLTLLADRMSFCVFSDAHYSINIPQDAKVGDTWPIHKRLVYGEVSIELVQARLAKLKLDDPNAVGIVLDIAPTNPSLVGPVYAKLAVNGQAADYADNDSGQWLEPSRTVKYTMETLPRGKVEVALTQFSSSIAGPWMIEWNSEVP